MTDSNTYCANRPIVPSILRDFLPESLWNLNERLYDLPDAVQRENVAELVVAEVRRALPIIRETIGNDRLPAPPPGISIQNLELEVRTYNCLVSLGIQDDLQLIGRLTINDLLKTRNFGVKSLVDLLSQLESIGAGSCGSESDHSKQLEEVATSAVAVREVIDLDDIEKIRQWQQSEAHFPIAILMRRLPEVPDRLHLDRLGLRTRTYNALEKAGYVANPQNLTGLPLNNLLSISSFGRESLADLLTKLAPFLCFREEKTFENAESSTELIVEVEALKDLGLSYFISSDDPRLGSVLHLICPDAKDAHDAAERLLRKEYSLADATKLVTAINNFRRQVQDLTQLQLEDELISFLTDAPNQKHAEIFARRFGFTGEGTQTFQELADVLGLTRERTRQICERIGSRFDRTTPFAPTLDKALDLVAKFVPCLETDMESLLVSDGVTKKRFQLQSLQSVAKLFGRDIAFSVMDIGGIKTVLPLGSETAAEKILKLARRGIEHWGAITIEEVAAQAAEETGLPSDLATRIISGQNDFRWLDETTGWFSLLTVPRNRLINQIEKILSIADQIDIGDLRAGVKRHHRMEGVAPPQDILLELCKQLDWCHVQNNLVQASVALDWREILSETEQVLVEILKSYGPVIQREPFEDECLARGVNRTTFYAYLNYSPVIKKHARGVYGLRGVNVPAGLVDSLRPASVRGRVLKDFGTTRDGKIWIAYHLSENSVLAGVCSVPSSLSELIKGEFRLLAALDGSEIGTLSTNGDSVWGLRSFFRRKGVEAGDYLVLVLHPQKRMAEAHLGDENLLEQFQPTDINESDQHFDDDDLGKVGSEEVVGASLIQPNATVFNSKQAHSEDASRVNHQISAASGLKELDQKWRAYFLSDACPPVPGLAPLSDEEAERIGQKVIVHAHLPTYQKPPWRVLFALIETFPACLAVWLARKAGEAYESGAFWEKFGELVGISIPMVQREEFANHFRRATWTTMTNWLPPVELGGHNIVSQFLHQAGLPLDRCAGFAQLVRKVERSIGLPEIESADAGEQLREAILEDLQAYPVPTLRRALQGPAGTAICAVALDVVFKGDFSGVNPRLGQELEQVFQYSGKETLRKSAAQPFLRIGADLGSLELVGPRQDHSLLSERGLTWVVDGRRYPTPRTEEFVVPVTDRTRVMIELAGLKNGSAPARTFALRLEDLSSPFMLFDAQTRKQRKSSDLIPPGDYFLLHRIEDALSNSDGTYEWTDGKRAISLFTLLPGTSVVLQSHELPLWTFRATLTPFFAPTRGGSIEPEDGEVIFYDWDHLPSVWLSTDEVTEGRIDNWKVRLSHNGREFDLKLRSSSDQNAGCTKCLIDDNSVLGSLSAGLHQLKLTLHRGDRSRIEAHAEYLFWKGLVAYDKKEFRIESTPHNLVESECLGFSFGSRSIRHLYDRYHHHSLTFVVADTNRTFAWTQPGVFLESLDRIVGQSSKARPHRLGEAFSANLESVRWLRIWLAAQDDWEVRVDGRLWAKSLPGDRRTFIDLSLSSLAVASPQGGAITLNAGGAEVLVARFTSPLHPMAIDRIDDGLHIGFRFDFTELITWVKPIVRELASGNSWDFEGLELRDGEETCFTQTDLQPIKCTRWQSSDFQPLHSVTLMIPKHNWEPGLWLIELEIRRDEHSEWERTTQGDNLHCPLSLCSVPTEVDECVRSQFFWGAVNQSLSIQRIPNLNEQDRSDLFELMADLIALQQQRVIPAAKRELTWLTNAVRTLSEVSSHIALQSNGGDLQLKLLNLACQDSTHAGFIYLPVLLALPSNVYRDLPTGDPLNDALRMCGNIRGADSIVDIVRDDQDLLSMHMLSCFANFNQLAAMPKAEGLSAQFEDFDYQRYWQQILGSLRGDRLASNWSGSELLGKEHLVSALEELVSQYDAKADDSRLGAANSLLHSASQFRAWLNDRLNSRGIMSKQAWLAPWPSLEAPNSDFLESTPRFASLFALAARAAAAGWLNFDEVMNWLEGRVPKQRMAEEGIAVLVNLAPELFGNQLMFWELMINTVERRITA